MKSVQGEMVLQVESLGACVGTRWILNAVSFEAHAGEITAVIGPNGAGKTTLLESIVGLRRANAGGVLMNGRRLDRFADCSTIMSFLPDAGQLPPEASVGTLVDYASSLGSPGPKVAMLRERLDIDPLLSKPVGVLSRGEHQRVALFCTLALGRPIIVLDEPFSSFDPLQLRSVFAVIREMADPSTAVIASIHQLGDAEKIADRVLLLADGKKVAFGDVPALKVQAGLTSGSLEDAFVALLSRRNDAS